MAALTRKRRCACPFLDEPVPAPPHLAKRARFSPAPAAFAAHQQQQQQAALSRVASAAARANGDGVEECAAILVDQMSASADVADAMARASAILKLIEAAVTTRAKAAAVALREENVALRARAEAVERDNGVLKRGVAEQHRRQTEMERDNGVLKHGVAVLHRREEAAQRAAAESMAREAAELRRKVAELEAANHALAARMLGADSCRFQAFHGTGPDVF